MKRFGVLALMLGLAVTPASAQSLQQQMSRCLAMTGALQRLACYDAVAHDAGVAPARSTAQPSAVPATAPLAPQPLRSASTQGPDQFGSEALPRVQAQRQRTGSITSEVVNLQRNDNGKFVVTLANGQVWRQLDGDTTPEFYVRRGPRNVTISRGFLGSYNMLFDKGGAYYKVVRVK